MIKPLTLALFTLLVSASILHAADKAPLIPVFVKDLAVATTGGFVPVGDDLGDSVVDLRKHLAGRRKGIRPAAKEADAKVVLEVVSRGMEADDEIHVLTVRLSTPQGYAENITVKDDSTYRNCALKILQKVEAFAVANRDRLK
jgi:hypothetical protein